MTTSTEPIAQTSGGRLRGATEGGVYVFRGIPYGEPPVGRLRFRPPLPASPWPGVRDATTFPPLCPQDRAQVGIAARLPQSEDCLALNIWTPAMADGGRRPVLVWLHGGGFRMGSGSSEVTNGARLAARGDAVVVTLNHRLHVFGHLYLDAIGGEEFAGSGVAGLLDIVLALRWLRDNVAAFGGDPNNLTIFGESGGGRKVSVLLGMPEAAGLFQRAIVQSGAHPRCVPPALATAFAERLLTQLGIAPSDLRRLQELPHEQLMDGMRTLLRDGGDGLPDTVGGRTMLLSPVVDGRHLPADPFDPVAAPYAADVPLLIGTNKDEAALFLVRGPRPGELTEAELLDRLRPVLGDRTAAIVAVYRRQYPRATPWDLLVTLSSEDRRLLSIETAERRAALARAPVYMYLFIWESDAAGGLMKAAHSLDVPFVFDNVDASPITGTRPDRQALADVISESWLAFARTGDPNNDRIAHWPAYDTQRRATMILDLPCRVEDDPGREQRLAWQGTRVNLPWEGPAFVGSF